MPTAACFFDIENDYNNVLVHKVITALDELRINQNTNNYVWSLFNDKQLMIKDYDGNIV